MAIFKDFWALLHSAYRQWREHGASSLAAALAYYALFSMVPLLILTISILGFFFGRDLILLKFQNQIGNLAGKDVGQLIVDVAMARHSKNLLAAAISALITIIASIGMFNHLRISLDKMFEASPGPRIPFHKSLVKNVGLFSILVGLGLMFFASTLASTALTVFASNLVHWQRLVNILDLPLFFILSTAFLACVYRLLPSAKLPWHNLLMGAAATSFFLTAGKLLIGTYLRLRDPGSTYGPASAVIALLVWVYYSAQIFYFGVEFTYAYVKRNQIQNP